MLVRILFSFFLLSVLTANSQTPDTLVVATYRYADNDRIKNISPFATYFGTQVKQHIKVKSYDSVQELINGMRKGQVDIAFINTFGYLLLREQSQDYSIAAALRIPSGTRSTYQTAIVSARKTNVLTIDDIQKQPGIFSLLLVNPGSTSGNLVPRLKFAEAGIAEVETFFTSVAYTKNHALTLEKIAHGEADIGAFGSEEFHKALSQNPTLTKNVHLVWESGPIQLGPVVFKKNLPKELTEALQQTLLMLHELNTNAFAAIRSGWTEAVPADKFQLVDDSYYDTILGGNRTAAMKIITNFAK